MLPLASESLCLLFSQCGKLFSHSSSGCLLFTLWDKDGNHQFLGAFPTQPLPPSQTSGGALSKCFHGTLCCDGQFPCLSPSLRYRWRQGYGISFFIFLVWCLAYGRHTINIRQMNQILWQCSWKHMGAWNKENLPLSHTGHFQLFPPLLSNVSVHRAQWWGISQTDK